MICVLVSSWSVAAETRAPFKLFEAIRFTGGPGSQGFGFEHLMIADPNVLLTLMF